MKSLFLLVYLKLLNVLFVSKIKRQLSISFVPKALWNGLNTLFKNQLSLYDLTPPAAFFGFTEKHLDDSILQNHLLLVFKIYLYKSRSYGFVCLKSLLLEIKKINSLEKTIAEANANKRKSYLFKWNKIDN